MTLATHSRQTGELGRAVLLLLVAVDPLELHRAARLQRASVLDLVAVAEDVIPAVGRLDEAEAAVAVPGLHHPRHPAPRRRVRRRSLRRFRRGGRCDEVIRHQLAADNLHRLVLVLKTV